MSSDRTGDLPSPVLEPFAAMPVEQTANRVSMDTANRACLWLFPAGRAGA